MDVALQSESLSSEQLESLASRVRASLDPMRVFQLYDFRVTAASNDSANMSQKHSSSSRAGSAVDQATEDALTVLVEPGSFGLSHQFRPWSHVLEVGYEEAKADQLDEIAEFISEHVRDSFQDEHDTLSYYLSKGPFALGRETSLHQSTALQLDRRTTQAFKYAPAYHLTFSLFTANSSPSAWEIEEALSQYLQPLLATLSGITNFTVETQVQLHAAISPSISGPHFDAYTGKWQLHQSDLSGFVNAAEWPLNPSIGSGATMNFVLYVPSKEYSPLVVPGDETSWLIPQWGGVQILNPRGDAPDRLGADDLRLVMLTFADQFLKLLGLPHSPQSLALRVSSLTRERATSLILSASSTLGALARLTLKLTAISIPASVANSVDDTIHHLDQACHDLRGGRFESALEHARIAEAAAEQAFFEPSMVGQVYFPDEHKVAVYVPLLGPMAVPLVMTAIKELRGLRSVKQKIS